MIECPCGRQPDAKLEMNGFFNKHDAFMVRRNGIRVVLTCPKCGNTWGKVIPCKPFQALSGNEEDAAETVLRSITL